MTDNEIIARLAGLEIVEAVDEGLKGLRVEDGKLFYGKGGLRYAIPGGGCKPWQPDTDITLWHGPGGLLEKIEEEGIAERFVRALRHEFTNILACVPGVADQSLWSGVSATTAQLSAALVATVKEQHADVHPA